jgi:hypothetical protein
MAEHTFECPLSTCEWTATEDPTCGWCKGTGHTKPSGLRTAYRCSGCGGTGQRNPLEIHLKWTHNVDEFVAEINALRSQVARAEAAIREWVGEAAVKA